MADNKKVIYGTVQLRGLSTEEWAEHGDFIPADREPCLNTTTGIIRYGDGVTPYKNLKDAVTIAAHYEGTKVKGEDGNYTETDAQVIERVLTAAGKVAAKDDIFIVKAEFVDDHTSYTSYVYNGTDWAAMDGNYDAENVFLTKDITLAGEYTRVGNLTKSSNTSTSTFSTKGKSIAAALTEMLSKRLQPKITSNPGVTITLNEAGAKEVGTKVVPTYTASLSAGSYTYGPATGITAKTWEITDTNGGEASTSSGSFSEITVAEDTNYTISAKATYDAGTVAVDNLKDPSNPTIQIAGGSKSNTSSAITGYRAWFYGYKNADGVIANPEALTSAQVRALTASNGSIPASITTDKMQQMFFCIPKGKKTSIAVANSTNGAPQTVTKATNAVKVEGAGGYTAADYDVWYVSNASAESGSTTFTITVS